MSNEENTSEVRVVVATDLGSDRQRGYIVRNAGCPNERHAMSKCGCKIIRGSREEAEGYADALRLKNAAQTQAVD